MRTFSYAFFCLLLLTSPLGADAQSEGRYTTDKGVRISDEYHYSNAFSGNRNYRIFLPPDYYKHPDKKYPVIYFFHGWAQRYFGSMGAGYSNYDKGEENDGDNIEKFVSENDVIVVKADGLNRYRIEPIRLSPYNVSSVTTFRQFPSYFKELVRYIDEHYRTIPDREHRAVSGLSMGGFMTFWLAAKFPDFISAAGNFCGSTEFMAGPVEFPVAYAHADMYDNFKATSIRMNNGTRDRLRFYHDDMNRYLLNVLPQYQFEIYDASHITCGLGDMFDFIMDAFESPLPLPEKWDFIDIYPFFEVWDYQVQTNRDRPGFTILENVNSEGFKIAVRNFLPDGELMPNVEVQVTTAPQYKKSSTYHIIDIDLRNGDIKSYDILSDSQGRLKIKTNGSLHQVGISDDPEMPNLGLAKVDIDSDRWVETGSEVELSFQVLNKGQGGAKGITGELVALSEGLEVIKGKGKLTDLASAATGELKGAFKVKNNKSGVDIAKLKLVLQDAAGSVWEEEFELLLKEPVEEITDFVIADGRELTVIKEAVDSVTGVVGSGNGDGIANPGETIVILVKEGGKYLRTNAVTLHPMVNANHTSIRIRDPWQEYDHIGGSFKYTMPVISSEEAPKKPIWFHIEYWIPGDISGQHIIKKGKVKVEVSGDDQTAPRVQWLQVTTEDRIEARVYDPAGVEKVNLTFIPNEEKSTLRYVNWEEVPDRFEVQLVDNGTEGDALAGDGIYSARIKQRQSYFYDLKLEMADLLGNSNTLDWPDVVFLKDTR